jgi:hypothetical protein
MPPGLQPLAVDLTLEAYRTSLAASSSAAAILVYAVSAEAPQLSASTAEQESYHPGLTSALPCCELAAPFMLEWSDDEMRKPDGFDASTTLRLSGVAGEHCWGVLSACVCGAASVQPGKHDGAGAWQAAGRGMQAAGCTCAVWLAAGQQPQLAAAPSLPAACSMPVSAS